MSLGGNRIIATNDFARGKGENLLSRGELVAAEAAFENSVEIGRGLLAEGYGSIDLALHLLGTERLLAETYSALDKS